MTVINPMETIAFPKHKRIVDPNAIQRARRDRCELCGSNHRLQVHHIKSRGAGGDDAPDNLICLCYVCHRKAHDGLITRERLRETRY